MKKTARVVAMLLLAPVIHIGQATQSNLARISLEQLYFYTLAVYGDQPCKVHPTIECQPKLREVYSYAFDPAGVAQARANEFDRPVFVEAMNRKVDQGLSRVRFGERFVYLTEASLEPYSFEKKSFPLSVFRASSRVPGDSAQIGWSYFILGNPRDGEIQVTPFSVDYAVNRSDFDWSLQVSEGEGRSLIEKYPARRVILRIVYSITRTKAYAYNNVFYLAPFVQSVEVLTPERTRLGLLLPRVGAPASAEQLQRRGEELHAGMVTLSCDGPDQFMPPSTELKFQVVSARTCPTPWLNFDPSKPPNIRESGNVLLQFRLKNGSVGAEFEDGPRLTFQLPHEAVAVRFRSLRKENITVTITSP